MSPDTPGTKPLGSDAAAERLVAGPQVPTASSGATTNDPDTSGASPAAAAGLVPAEQAPEASASEPAPAARTGGLLVALTIISFVLEVALMGALGIWGLTMLSLSPVAAVLVAVVPVLIFWGIFMSPKAKLRLPQPYHAVVAHVLFAGGAILLAVSGQPVLAVCMGGLTALSLALTVAVRGQNVVDPKKSTGRRAAR